MAVGSPLLRTQRLELTPLADPDADPLRRLLSLEPVRHYLLDGHVPDAHWVASVVADARADFARRGLGLWAARRPGDPSLVGLVGFRDFFEPPVEELLFALHPDAWGRGLATEMGRAAIAYAFTEAGRERVRATTDVPNRASLSVLRRLGLRETAREPAPAGYRWDQVRCVLERGDWQPGASTAAGPRHEVSREPESARSRDDRAT